MFCNLEAYVQIDLVYNLIPIYNGPIVSLSFDQYIYFSKSFGKISVLK